MKLDLNGQLNVSTKRSNLASANDQGLLKFKNKGNYRFILRVFLLQIYEDFERVPGS